MTSISLANSFGPMDRFPMKPVRRGSGDSCAQGRGIRHDSPNSRGNSKAEKARSRSRSRGRDEGSDRSIAESLVLALESVKVQCDDDDDTTEQDDVYDDLVGVLNDIQDSDDNSVSICELNDATNRRMQHSILQRSKSSSKSSHERFSSHGNSQSSMPLLESFCHGSSNHDSLFWESSAENSVVGSEFAFDMDVVVKDGDRQTGKDSSAGKDSIDTSFHTNELRPVAKCATMQRSRARWEISCHSRDSLPSVPSYRKVGKMKPCFS